ncbi:hypothetical protein GO627_21235 [Aeromonas veronii]|nr:hypothetical protein GO627_21235 [Aeromonas veronii]
MIASSMAGAGQLVAGSVDLVHLVALAFDGHGVPVSSHRAPAVPVATVPGQVVIWMVWCAPAAPPDRAGTRASCDLDAREGGLLLARGERSSSCR